MNQSMSQQRGSVPNDYVQLPTIPSTAEKSEEPPLIVGDHQLPSRVLGRYVSVCVCLCECLCTCG